MTRWVISWLIALFLVNTPTSLAFDIPYGVQDPFRSTGYLPCSGGEVGYWQIHIQPPQKDGEKHRVWLIVTTVDMLDPAFVICFVEPDQKIIVAGKEKKI